MVLYTTHLCEVNPQRAKRTPRCCYWSNSTSTSFKRVCYYYYHCHCYFRVFFSIFIIFIIIDTILKIYNRLNEIDEYKRTSYSCRSFAFGSPWWCLWWFWVPLFVLLILIFMIKSLKFPIWSPSHHVFHFLWFPLFNKKNEEMGVGGFTPKSTLGAFIHKVDVLWVFLFMRLLQNLNKTQETSKKYFFYWAFPSGSVGRGRGRGRVGQING